MKTAIDIPRGVDPRWLQSAGDHLVLRGIVRADWRQEITAAVVQELLTHGSFDTDGQRRLSDDAWSRLRNQRIDAGTTIEQAMVPLQDERPSDAIRTLAALIVGGVQRRLEARRQQALVDQFVDALASAVQR